MRVLTSLKAMAVALDVLSCAAALSILWLFDLCDKPTGRQTWSGYVGRAANNGHNWGIKAEAVIDFIMGKGHCLNCFLKGQAQ